MIQDKLSLDERDNVIIQMLQKDPNVSQEDIAKKVKLSQPSVWARIRNLKEKGIINHIIGMNFKTVDLDLAKVDVSATDTQAIIDEFNDCPYFINAMITSGKFNVCIVNHHLRGNPKVKDVELNIVISTAKKFVLPLNLVCGDNQKGCKKDCQNCLK